MTYFLTPSEVADLFSVHPRVKLAALLIVAGLAAAAALLWLLRSEPIEPEPIEYEEAWGV